MYTYTCHVRLQMTLVYCLNSDEQIHYELTEGDDVTRLRDVQTLQSDSQATATPTRNQANVVSDRSHQVQL